MTKCNAMHLRTPGAGTLALALLLAAGCGGHGTRGSVVPDGQDLDGQDAMLGGSMDAQPFAKKALDLLLVVDDSRSMNPLQEQFERKIDRLLSGLKSDMGELPDLHLAVITPNMGAAAHTASFMGSESRCDRPDGGVFLSAPRLGAVACEKNKLEAGAMFLKHNPRERNYVGDLATTVGCLTRVGASGCGFEQPLAAVRAALGDPSAGRPMPAANAGFLRADAHLAIVFLTNEDDCSVPEDSVLFDPSEAAVARLGELSSVRCTRFGILCGGTAPPTDRETGNLMSCVSNDALSTAGASAAEREANRLRSLIPTTVFKAHLENLRTPDKLDVLLIGGPTDPFRMLYGRNFVLGNSSGFPDKIALQHSCAELQTNMFADPPVRLAQLVSSLGGMVSGDACGDFGFALEQFGKRLRDRL